MEIWNIPLFSGVVAGLLWRAQLNRRKIFKKDRPEISRRVAALSQEDEKVYDVLIVGAGPSGSTAAYYLGKLSDLITAMLN